ncbi:TrmH family RNA methyltransferase [Clostridium neuense]|uniref:TrmH family RNA methyltransferase n=1 Tax=Clostridium neuense TaxID=1728934 RepID=A0ABW8TJN8_9CLOT
MEVIKSKENNLIKEVRKLKEKKYRDLNKSFLIEGFRFVEEALKSNFEVKYVFICEKQKEKFQRLGFENLIDKTTKSFEVSESVLNTISSTETPQGIVAVVKNKISNLQIKNGFYILIDKVQDPGNMGTIIRSANASGALGVIITKGTVDTYNNKTLRSTMGSIFKIPIIFEDSDFNNVKKLKENEFKLITSSLNTEYNFYDIDLKGKVIIAVGNEGNGISKDIFGLSDISVKIPMPGNAESLNVGVAASIMMFEAVRQIKIE